MLKAAPDICRRSHALIITAKPTISSSADVSIDGITQEFWNNDKGIKQVKRKA